MSSVQAESIKRVVVRGTNWVGDSVMTIPALRALRRVLPDANILIGEIGKPLAELMFLVGLRGPSDPFSLGARIIAPDKSLLVSIEKERALKLPLIDPERGVMGGIGFAGLVFRSEGLHTIKVLIDDQEKHSATFTVRQGSYSG